MKITLYSGEREMEYYDCDLESCFAELTFVGRPYIGFNIAGQSRFGLQKRYVTTLGYIIETEVDEPRV